MILKDEASKRFPHKVGQLVRYDDAHTATLALDVSRGTYQRAIVTGKAHAWYAGGGYGKSLQNLLERLEQKDIFHCYIVLDGMPVLCLGHRYNVKMAKETCCFQRVS